MRELETNLTSHVAMLSGEIGERNYACYDALKRSAGYILGVFSSYGYVPRTQAYSSGGLDFHNIGATKKGIREPERILVVGAHYDSVAGSPGADDNASGVAALLELSGLLRKSDTGMTIEFVAFANEEPPFFLSHDMGSRVYAKDAQQNKRDIAGMICLESLGYYSDERRSQSYPPAYSLFYPDRGNFIGAVSNFRSQRLLRAIESAFERYSSIPVVVVAAPEFVPGVNFSDHDSFWKHGYTACMVTDTAFYRNPHYHTSGDTFDTLDYPRLTAVTEGLYHAVLEISGGW
jgi:Zn-dependent M28 family amino/carboxypeptidase